MNLSSPKSDSPESFLQKQACAYDNLLRAYEGNHEICDQLRRDVFARVVTGLRKGASVLDVGCGAGLYLSLMADGGFDAEGIDLSPNMVAAARTRSARPVTCADFRTATFSKAFDLVFAQAFVHLFRKAEVLEVINKLCSLSRKRLYFSTSITSKSSEGWEDKNGTSRFRSRYTGAEFEEIVAKAALTGPWNVETFELIDPEGKHWVQALFNRH